MKKTLLVTLLLTCAVGLYAKVNHPCLLYTPERTAAVQKKIASDSAYSRAWQSIRQMADNEVQRNSTNIRNAEYLVVAYQLTGDKRYAEQLRTVLLKAVEATSWGDAEMMARRPAWRSELQMAHKSFSAAVAYDAVYDYLSPADRKKIAEGFYRLSIEPSLGDWLLEPTRIHSLNSMGHNWWTSCVYMPSLLALSLENELPQCAPVVQEALEVMPQWFNFAGDVFQKKARTFDRNGGMYESINYASFGIQEALLFRLAYSQAHPREALPVIPQLAQLPQFFLSVCYPRTGVLWNINFGDSHKNVTADGTLLPLYALGIDNADDRAGVQWYLSQVEDAQHRDGFFLDRPFGLYYLPEMDKAPEKPKAPLSCLYPDFGWATLRTSWQKDATLLAVKSGHTWNHSHADANSFIVFHKGVDLLKDAGNCSYANENYRDYFFQSKAHNVVLFNGEGQSAYQQYHGTMLRGNLYHLLDGGTTRYLLADGTGPYSNNFYRNMRNFLWIDNVIYVIDDLKTYQHGTFEWLWHTGGKAEKKGYDLVVTQGDASLIVRPLYPSPLAPSGFVHDYPTHLTWSTYEGPTEDLKGTETYWGFQTQEKMDKVKGVTAIILKETADQTLLPQIERRQGEDWIGLRITQGDKVTDLYLNNLADGTLMHSNSWIYPDGWETDAYLLAVSYPKGQNPQKAQEVFMAYGSSLRTGGQVWFSSFSKLNYIQRAGELFVNGQPTLQAYLRPMGGTTLTVNGKKSPLKQKNGLLKVVLESLKN